MRNTCKYYCAFISAAILLGGCGLNVSVTEPKPAEIPADVSEETDADIPAETVGIRDCVTKEDALGEGAVFGTCIGLGDISDDALMQLIYDNYNAVTLENELKPDAMLGHSNNGVPTLDHSRADAILDTILEHNTKDPERPIRVRGHVLVWHSQTPDWFFREDYDSNKDYVSSDEMNTRMEWYIRSMLEYYTGENSKYADLFYGWDVVNEAISDRTGSYRSDTEGSTWWKIYGSNEYIINAFRYANMYAPSDLDLYYNDYNDCDKKKIAGILKLIDDVKAAEGTRLDGFGMQGHYGMNAPTAETIEECARRYASAVDKIMITELDVKTSMFFKNNEEGIRKEYERQADYYASIYDVLKKLHKDGIDVAGLTFWGVIDTRTWLGKPNCPLLFDGQYQPKPAYYVFMQ